MISEEEFKNRLIEKLNQTNDGWVDGDKERREGKKVDIVHHNLKIAIEVKDDTKNKRIYPTSGQIITQSKNLTLMNAQWSDDIKSANEKFQNYRSYKTILLIRTDFDFSDVIRYAIEGPKVLHDKNTSQVINTTRPRKYSDYVFKNIGCFLIFNKSGVGYFLNELSDVSRRIEKTEVEKIFQMKFKEINSIWINLTNKI